MSIKAMSEVWEHSKQKGNGLLLLLAIADFANDELKCFPSVDRLAFKTRMSRRNVQTLVRQMAEEGEILIHENAGPKGCNVYEIRGVQTLHGCKPAPEKGTGGDANERPALASEPSVTVQTEPSVTDSASAPPKAEGKPVKEDSKQRKFVQSWEASYKAHFGKKYIFTGRDWRPLKTLLSQSPMTPEQLVDLAWRAWKCRGKDYWNCERAGSVQFFCEKINQIMDELGVEGDAPRDTVEDNHETKYGVPRGSLPLSQRPVPGEDENGVKIGMEEWGKRFPITLYDQDR